MGSRALPEMINLLQSDPMLQPAVPAPGQVVEVRQRQWVVLEVGRSTTPDDPLRLQGPSQHFVSLSSIEEDALGEELHILWELEPGVCLREQAALPAPEAGFDEPVRLDTFLDAVRWGAVSSANTRRLQAPFRSGIAIEDYQLDPVARALTMPRVNLLIADDVGLGKTIEAGLVAQELLLRHRARSILIVCPSALQLQWQEQMRDKFGLAFRMVDSELAKRLRRQRGLHINPWTHFPRLITSIDFLKRERPLQLFREVLPAPGAPAYPRRFDLLIVDEAHNVAPPGTGRYATDSLRTLAVRTLSPHFEHKLFLTATPHNGYWESFSALLELLDNQRFARGVRPDPAQLERIMVRRLKRELPPRWDGTPRFPERKLEALEVEYSEAERQAHRQLHRYAERRQQGAQSEPERVATEFVLKLLKKRLFSSPAAFLATLAQHRQTLERVRSAPARAPAPPSLGILRARLEGLEEEFADDAAYEDTAAELTATATRWWRPPSDEEQALLEQLQHFAERACARPDAKAAALVRWLEGLIRPAGRWGERRVLIFTEYRATQNWLYGLLAAAGLAQGGRLKMLYGGMDSGQREAVKAAFQASPADSPLRILLATDAASEGVNLQNHCAHLLHYEIPWNPNRLEQRNGRIDRHGQREGAVWIYHFVGAGYRERLRRQRHPDPGELEGDLEFLMRAAIKVDSIREDLGKVGSVIAAQVEEAMLGRRRQLQTAQAEDQARAVRKRLTFERNLREQLARLYEQLQETQRELGLSPESVQRVVEAGLELAGQPPLREAQAPGLWPDPTGVRSRCPVFHLPPLRGSWSQCAEGFPHPHTGQIRPLVFDHGLAQGRDDVVLVHLNHRLVQMALHLLRAEVWSGAGRRKLHRVTARQVPRRLLDTPAVIAHGRIVVLGGDNHRLHEEMIHAGGYLREGRWVRMQTVGEVDKLLEAALPASAPEALKARLAALWPTHCDGVLKALEARMRDRTQNLQRFLDERRDREVADITAVLVELRRGIEAELAAAESPLQYELWSETEQAQLARDRANLRARLDSIPLEIERETAAIQARYANPAPRLFPVAVTYLVPENLV